MSKVLMYAAIVILICGTALGQAEYVVLYSFANSGHDGELPNAGFVSRGGQLYGTTSAGGAYCEFGCGTVFALESSNGTVAESVIYSFCTTGNVSTCQDGAYPFGGLVADQAGNLYGTTQAGGPTTCNDQYITCGVVFELTRSGQNWTETVLHAFGGPDGERPTGQLAIDATGNLYGTTVYGGAYGAGIVFEVSPGPGGTWTEKTLHDFDPANGDGAEPYLSGVTLDALGNIYGTTATNGAGLCQFDQYSGCGTVFELSPGSGGTWTESIIYKSGQKMAFPLSSLILDDAGNLYGTTLGGNNCQYNCGGVFRLTFEDGTWKENSFVFDSEDGASPEAGLLLINGALYGTTLEGGQGGGSGYGVFFRIRDDRETVLHSFSGYPTDGAYPAFGGSLFLVNGRIYGATQYGGTSGAGTIFQWIF
jgi:uncharacterized repeat protein (TIGR03803 family)